MNAEARAKSDLIPRVITGLALAIICLGAIWFGGLPLLVLAVALAGLMCWELCRLTVNADAKFPLIYGTAGGLAVLVSSQTTGPSGMIAIAGVLLLGGLKAQGTNKAIIICYSFVILFAALAIFSIRDIHGIPAIFWLIFVVVATDIAGYFVGRSVGGPKFWPAISPKKTWSGVVGGWAAAVFVSLVLAGQVGLDWKIAALCGLVLSFASQLGDIAESAIKRRAGVKDSSKLLPGHGGFLDRFDAMIAVMCLAFVFQSLIFGSA